MAMPVAAVRRDLDERQELALEGEATEGEIELLYDSQQKELWGASCVDPKSFDGILDRIADCSLF